MTLAAPARPPRPTWRDYRCDLQQFTSVVGDWPPGSITFSPY